MFILEITESQFAVFHGMGEAEEQVSSWVAGSAVLTANQFSVHASPVVSPAGLQASQAPADRAKHHMLVIGDSITCNVKSASSASSAPDCCLPGARASYIEANLRVLASHRAKQETQAHSTTRNRNIATADTNNVPLKQSKITKDSLARNFQAGRKMCQHQLIIVEKWWDVE